VFLMGGTTWGGLSLETTACRTIISKVILVSLFTKVFL
jgi:hypothetical protein